MNIGILYAAFLPISVTGGTLIEKISVLSLAACIDGMWIAAISEYNKNDKEVIKLVGDKEKINSVKRKIELRNKEKELKKKIDNSVSNNVNKSHNDFINGQINLFENYENVHEFKDEKVKVKTLKK